MDCLKCDREVVEQAKFCSYCGYRVAVECPSCGVLNQTDALFCYDCGWSLTVSEAESSEATSRQPEPTTSPAGQSRDDGSGCPRCGTAYEPGSTYCYQCGLQGRSPGPVVREADVAPSGAGQRKIVGSGCPRCQAVNEPESTYCYKCGLPLEGETRPDTPATHTQPLGGGPYKSPRTLANWTVGLLVAMCVVYALHMMVTFGVLDLVGQREAGQFVSNVEFDEALFGLDGVSFLVVVVYVPTVVLFLMWIYRASRNLQPLDSHSQRFSPGWAVGWWFIPVLWYIFPYQVMAEVWRGSNPHTSPDVDWKKGTVSALLGWWWGLWLVYNFLSFMGGYSFGFAGVFDWDLTPSSGALQLDLFTSALAVSSGVLAILVVLQITRRQEDKRSRNYGRLTK